MREICFIGTPITEALEGASAIPILSLCPQRDFLRSTGIMYAWRVGQLKELW